MIPKERRQTMIDTIIFDIGKVLVDWNWKEYLESYGFGSKKNEILTNAVFLSEYWIETDRGVWSDEQILQSFLKKAPGCEQEIQSLWDGMGQCVKTCTYTKSWIQELKQQKYKVYYLSNYGKTLREKTKEALDFTKDCDGGIFSYEVKLVKPDLAIYQALLEKYNLTPQQCIFLDDRPENVAAAQQAGMHGIVFEEYQQAKKKISEIAEEI